MEPIAYKGLMLLGDVGIYALLALGLALAFRVIRFPDLTAEGAFVSGAVAFFLVTGGNHQAPQAVSRPSDGALERELESSIEPTVTTPSRFAAPLAVGLCIGFGAGMIAGAVTGIVHVGLRVPNILAGIMTWMALYSINLRALGRPNVQLRQQQRLVENLLDLPPIQRGAMTCLRLAVVTILVAITFYVFMESRVGYRVRCAGGNPYMAASYGLRPAGYTVLGLACANGLVGLSGALFAAKAGYVDINMGVGMLIAGIVPIFLGGTLFPGMRASALIFAAVAGAIGYRLVVAIALELHMNPQDVRLLTVGLLLVAVVLARYRSRSSAGIRLEALSLK